MIVNNYKDVEAIELLEGVTKRVVIGEKEGAPNFIMRVIEIKPGCSSPYHEHPWEHEMFIVKGDAAAKDEAGEETSLREGDTVFIPPMEKHSIVNKGQEPLCLLCLIPSGVE